MHLQAGKSVSAEDVHFGRADSESTVSVEDDSTLKDVINSQRCSSCHSLMTEYEEEDAVLCIVVLSTFIHRDPELAAPILMDMLITVSRSVSS